MADKILDLDEMNENGGVFSTPIIYDEKLYTASCDKYVYCLEPSSGEEIWTYRTNGMVMSSPFITNNILLIGSFDKYLYALDAETGEMLWKARLNNRTVSSPVVYDDIIYIGSCDGHMYALGLDGDVRWKFKTGGEIYNSPIAYDGRLYFGSEDTYFYCLTTGEKRPDVLWKFKTGDAITSFMRPTMAKVDSEIFIYFGSGDQNMYALDAKRGEKKWRFRTGDIVWSVPTIYEGVAYFGARDRHFYALDAKTGRKLWMFRAHGPISNKPLVYKDDVYFSSNFLYSLKKDGTLKWQLELIACADSSMICYKNRLFFGGWDTYIYSVSVDGNVIWKKRTNSPQIIMAEGVVPPMKWDSSWLKKRDRELLGVTLREELSSYDKATTEEIGGQTGYRDKMGKGYFPAISEYGDPKINGYEKEPGLGGYKKRGQKKVE